MKKTQINFTTSEVSGAIARDKRKWEAFVQSNGTVDDAKYYQLVGELTNQEPETIRYIDESGNKTKIRLLREGYTLNIGDVTLKPVLCGPFSSPDAHFDPKVNKLQVVAIPRGALKTCLKDLNPVNLVKPPSPTLQSVIDAVTGQESVLTIGNTVYGAGRNLAADPTRSDERGVLETLDGEIAAVGTITDSTLQTVNVTFAEWPEPGTYRFALSTRSGMSEEYTLTTVRKTVQVVAPKNATENETANVNEEA